MDDAAIPKPVEDLEGFVRVPGVFRRSEIEQVLRPGCDFHIQPERLPPGTHLFTVYQQEPDEAASWPVCGPALADRGAPRAAAAMQPPAQRRPHESDVLTWSRARPEPMPSPARYESRWPLDEPSLGEPSLGEPSLGEPSLGELKARRREEHLCFACTHHLVCGMAGALDENLLVTISRCRGFEPAERGDSTTCELIPIEPSAAP